jgi:hypothetical protein
VRVYYEVRVGTKKEKGKNKKKSEPTRLRGPAASWRMVTPRQQCRCALFVTGIALQCMRDLGCYLGLHAASGAAWLDSSAAQLNCYVNTGRNTTGSIGAFQPAFTQDHYDGSGITWPALWWLSGWSSGCACCLCVCVCVCVCHRCCMFGCVCVFWS